VKTMRLLFVVAALVLTGACSTSPSAVLPPLALTDIEAPLSVRLRWKTTVKSGVSDRYLKLRPLIEQGVGYAADYSGYVRAFDPLSGQKIWQQELAVSLVAGPSLVENLLLFGTDQGEVIALEPASGKLIWRTEVSSEVLAPPQGEANILIVRSVDGRIHALEADTGKRLWVFDRSVPLLTLRGISTPVIQNGIVIVGADSGKLTALTLQDGTVLWETQIAVSRGRNELERMVDIDVDPIVNEGVIYVVTYQGRLATVQLDSGRILWVRDISSYAGMALDAYRLYLTDSDSQIWALNRFNGSTLWRQDKLLRRAVTAPVLLGSHLVVADYQGYVHWLNREDGKIVARKSLHEADELFSEADIEADDIMFPKDKNVLVAPVVDKDMVIIYDRKGNMAAYQLQKD